MRVSYGAVGGAFTPGNTMHFPSSMRSCQDFVACDRGVHVGWFIHEAGHSWQHQMGRSPVLGHIFSEDVLNFGNYLRFEIFLKTPVPGGLNTEKEADWHMYNYMCRNGLKAGC